MAHSETPLSFGTDVKERGLQQIDYADPAAMDVGNQLFITFVRGIRSFSVKDMLLHFICNATAKLDGAGGRPMFMKRVSELEGPSSFNI